MDTDMSMSGEDDFIQYFDLTPEQFPWRASVSKEIEVRRAHMSDMLIFDILLSLGNIRHPHTLFPPADTHALHRLLEAITHSSYDKLKRDCLVYYLLKWHQDGREEDFREKRCIPPQFVSLAAAYWHLDSNIQVARAVSLLSDKRLNRDFPSKILQALSLSEDSSALIREYVRTVNPILTEPDDLDTYVIALAESSLMEAWTYQRSFSEVSETRGRLIRKILDWCLTPKPRLTPLTHLLSFPFSPYEQSLVHSYALEPPPELSVASIPIIQDLVCVRLVQSGQHVAAIKLDRQFSSVPRGGDQGQKIAQERRQMMDELMAAMTSAERYSLELELENFAQGRSLNLSDSVSVKPKVKGADFSSMSWEHISAPKTNGAAQSSLAPPTLPIPQRLNAPRFGGAPPAVSSISAPFTTVSRGMPMLQSSSAVPQMPKPPSGPLLFGGLPMGTSSTSTNGLFGKTSTSTGGFANGFARSDSIFEVSGSANSAPNAFYQPPPVAGQKRSLFGALNTSTTSRPPALTSAFASLSSQPNPQTKKRSADTSIHGPHDADISMLSELSEAESAAADASMSREEPADRAREDNDEQEVRYDEDEQEDDPAGFTQSVFGNVPSAHTRQIATSAGARVARTVTEAKLPPGAFLPEDDAHEDQQRHHQEEHESVSATRTRGSRKGRASASAPSSASASASARTRARAQRSPSPEQEQERPSVARSTRTRRAVKDKDLNRSIPGSLMDDDDDDDDDDEPQQEEEEEEEDVVAPLPPPTPARRSSRKGRASNGPVVEAPRVTRRSSRLSAVSSVGSSSPEPLSPQKVSAKARRGGRTSTSTAGAGHGVAKSTGAQKGSARKRRA
ncbi:nuclear pore complex assembly-domain-containing protein [Trametes elegans]|nr:nuclear pore complex assembly-domain-containing protein [Trametes elegans]